MLVLTATTPTGAVSASSERSGGAAGGPWLSTSQVGWEVTDPLAHLLEMRRLVECTNACALPGVALKYDNFIPVMWQAVARGFVKHEHACFVADGLRLGFTAGFDHSKMFGHRWFKNYPTATSDSAVPAVVDATLKRVAAGKTLDLGVWGGAASAAIKFWCKCSAIFPMGAVPKPLEPDALRPTDLHLWGGATSIFVVFHSLCVIGEGNACARQVAAIRRKAAQRDSNFNVDNNLFVVHFVLGVFIS